ncbi:Hypothetical protein D9617_1g081610 [Elsinoe fawcettii]|nr:Hypothetical protein D9617_1g081610 [Elsinoe fawcettii]
MLFPIKESALPSKSAASFKYAQTPRQVVRSIVAGRPPKQPIQITGNPDQVDHMVNRIKKLVERTASKAPSPESDDPILPSGKGTWKPFRHFMRSVVNPVAILTTRLPNEPFNSEERFLGCRGTTISSLTSVTLQPAPVITFNLHAESRTAQKLEHAGYCDIHLLSSSAAGVDIAQPFAATKGLSLLEPFRIVDGLEHAHIDIQDDGAVYINSPGVLAHLRCRMIEGKTVRIGDHKVMFCEVVEAVRRSTETDYSWADITEPLHETCLTYADRKYGTMHSPSHLTSTPVPIDTTNTTSTGGSDQASPHQQDSARSMNYDHIKAQTDQMLNQILAKENAKASSSSTIACSATTRQFSTSAIHHPFPPCRRRYSTRAAPDPQQPDRIPPSSPDFLKQTVATFLAYDSFPKGRWVNDRWIRELQDCGPGRVQLAIRGGQPDAPDDGRPGGKRNARDMRIRKLIEHLHRAQKNGHVDDSVMQELVLGKGARGLDGKM